VTPARRVACGWSAAILAVACHGSGGGSPATADASTGDAGDELESSAPFVLSDADPAPPPSVGTVSPSTVFLARTTQIVVDGAFTNWTGDVSVDLGAGVTVGSVTLASAQSLVVDLTVSPTASPGPRDVTVLEPDGGAETTDPGALTLAPPVALSFDGTLAQGSIVVAHVFVLDDSIALDTTSTTDPLGNVTYLDLATVLSPGLTGTVLAATSDTADVQLFIDEGATAGPADFDLVSGPPGAEGGTHFPSPGGVPVSARSPVPLVAGTPATGSVISKYATSLFEYTPPSASPLIVDFSASSSATDATPAVLLLPASGAWSDELIGGPLATWLTTSPDPIYAVYFDQSGSTGAFSVGLTTTVPAASAPASPVDATMAGAVDATALPFVLLGGLLTSSASQDWVRVTTGPDDADAQLEVQSAGDPQTFLDVTIYDADGTTSIGGNETGGPVHAVAGPLAASSTYYVVFSAGAGFTAAHGAYAGIIRLE
jgi:hypothetical protein